MKHQAWVIESFDPINAPEAVWASFFELNDAIHYEIHTDPDDLPMPHEMEKAFRTRPRPSEQMRRWLAWDSAKRRVIGSSASHCYTEDSPMYGSNKHILGFSLSVAKDARRLGLGKDLIRAMLATALRSEVKVLHGVAFHPTGVRFAEALGGELMIEAAENMLKFSDVDWALMGRWSDEGPLRAPGVRLEQFEKVPESILEEYCQFYTEVVNQQPMAKEEGRFIVTPELRRQHEQRTFGMGVHWLTFITRELDGTISGLTEIQQVPGEPHRVNQLLTGVRASHRGRGLGKWLKGAMLLHVRKSIPTVKMIFTGNADTNAPMLAINNRMGFRRYLTETKYSFKLSELRARLGI